MREFHKSLLIAAAMHALTNGQASNMSNAKPEPVAPPTIKKDRRERRADERKARKSTPVATIKVQ